MKRMLPLLLALALLLAACGTTPAAETSAERDQPLPPESEPDPAEVAAAPSDAPDEGAAPSPARSDSVVTLDGVSSYLRVTLPETWTFEMGESTADSRVVILHPEDDESFAVELRWWSFFGMCGTGVTFADYPLPDGRTATLATEPSGDSQFWTLILPESPDSFTIDIYAKVSAFAAHEEELELLLGSIQTGVLAGLDPVTPETSMG